MKTTIAAFLLCFSVNIVAAQTTTAPQANQSTATAGTGTLKPAAPTLRPGQDVPLTKLEVSDLARVNQQIRACVALQSEALANWKLAEAERQSALTEQAKLSGQVIERAKSELGVDSMYDNRGSETGHFPVIPTPPPAAKAEQPKPTPAK